MNIYVLVGVISLVGLFLLVYFKQYATLKKLALNLIYEAEEVIIGEKAGDQKFTYVLDTLYRMVPFYLKFIITESMLENLIQTLFYTVKDKLK